MPDQNGETLLKKTNQVQVKVLTYTAAWVLAAMMFLTFADVCLRYLFNSPILGAPEMIELMMAIVIPFSIAYTAQKRMHISVDFMVERFPASVRGLLDCLISLLVLGLFLSVTWQSFLYVVDEYEANLTTATLYIPVFPFIVMVSVGFLSLTLILLEDLFINLSKAVNIWTRS
jgi:TRAP-type C4-dicarboxylate transport system permease small subunit